ncbi:GNAT family N-acetyltransferase [Dongia sedimenti]|uniref:N-acetyltransferase n=1 Tax=Dongia sedimenti TaxID=3064282 RepID=A0ABU0YNU0_9PROT|nr:N-acetyltransferase [Rhodospirillaceae bacterium R-7]
MTATEAQFSIKPESAALAPRVELLLDRVFGAERREKASYLFREGVAPVAPLSFVALDHHKKLVGSIRYWPIQVGETGHPALLLGPLAITPQLAGKGIGRALTFRTLEIAAEMGYDLVLLVGDYDYYKRFGFVPATPYGFVMPTEKRPERLQVTELKPGVLGRVSGEIRHVKESTGSVVAMPVQPPRRRVRRAAARA